MTTPPATCDSQQSLLMTRPQSCTATTLVQRTTPVSVSTRTSAIWTPPTPTFDRPGVQSAAPLAVSMPSLAQASFQDQLLLLVLSTILPASMVRLLAWAPSRPAIFSNRASRAAVAAFKQAGDVPGVVVLPPEPPDRPYWLSPIRTVISLGPRPSVSAVTMARTVRSPVPRSCVEPCTSTEPSLATV